MKPEAFKKEHERLLRVLIKGDKEDRKKEAKTQGNELERFLEKRKCQKQQSN